MPRSTVIASSVDWYTNRSRFGLARNLTAAAIGSVEPGQARVTRQPLPARS